MAHGEMLMLGAYSTWMVQQFMGQFMPQWLAFYPVVALPVAFLIAAGTGMALERGIIRHLYGRPLETLLATWGISLMLIQLVRMTFGGCQPCVAFWRGAGLCQPDVALEPYRGAGVRHAGAVFHLAIAE